METAPPMESTEPPPAITAPPPSTSSDPAPPPATAPELEAAVASNPPAPSSQQQPQPSTSQAGTPKIPQSASPFPSLQQPADLSSQTPAPPPQSQLQSHFQTQPQPQAVAPPVTPSPQARPLSQSQPAQPQLRPPQPGRPLRPTQSSFSSLFPPHLSSSAPTAAGPSSSLPSAAPSLPSSAGPLPRGGMAIGVPAALHHQRSPQQSPVSFSTFGPSAPFSQMFNGLPRGSVSVPNQAASAAGQVRQPVHTIPSGGMVGARTASSMRPGGVFGSNQQGPGQLILRTTSPSNTQSSTGQKFQSHGMIRGPASFSGSTLPGSSQSSQPLQQPWLSGPGRPTNPPSLSTASYRPQNKAQGLQQRPQQQQQSMPTTSQQSQMPSSQQQQKPLQHLQQQQHQKQQQHQQPQQTPQQQQQQPPLQPQQQQQQQQPQVVGPIQSLAKVQQSTHQQQQSSRSANQKTPAPATLQQGATQPGRTSPTAGMDVGEPGNRIISKRSIHELVTQIDPSEKLDPEVEDILVEIAEDFVESVTTFGCYLAKHRKSTILEAKDILLHLERNWNMTIPGFGGDEIKCFKKPFTNDIHKERLSLIKKSMSSTPDAGNAKNSAAGQTATNSKSHATKAPLIGSPRVT